MPPFLHRLALLLCLTTPAAAQDTDLELVLLADASGSISQAELMFQRLSYAKAITDPRVLGAIAETAYGSIAVTYVEWATGQGVVVPWTRIATEDQARAFAAALTDGGPRGSNGRNAIGSALLFGRDLIDGNDIEGWRKVIDFSGDTDGNTYGPPIEQARDAVVADGITINALAVTAEGARADLPDVYERRIIGGNGAFVVEAATRDTFVDAIRRKLILEIAGRMPPRRVARAD
ncbi:DUF1194 domain-containing protein [Jannaschia sp. LMIT008]|uniref:DUF1194 domain-containing protein n=1 Tax=Jannaschia maritima TaxID=3032585 RepID=UPI0028113174|nr:DUF1194 domain-containing protein [Jannaschia sp. LMIT008]